jgi:hypothetical protein
VGSSSTAWESGACSRRPAPEDPTAWRTCAPVGVAGRRRGTDRDDGRRARAAAPRTAPAGVPAIGRQRESDPILAACEASEATTIPAVGVSTGARRGARDCADSVAAFAVKPGVLRVVVLATRRSSVINSALGGRGVHRVGPREAFARSAPQQRLRPAIASSQVRCHTQGVAPSRTGVTLLAERGGRVGRTLILSAAWDRRRRFHPVAMTAQRDNRR